MATTGKKIAVEGIEIAKPLYDAVFKRLMENTRVATYFIESFIGEKIESITMVAQDNTIFKWAKKFDESRFTPKSLELLKKLTVIRLDFVATIKVGDGEYKKALIEIQKAHETSDNMRFRTCLAEQYKRENTLAVDNKTESAPLPIITV